MKKQIIILALLMPTFCFAQISLHNINSEKYEKKLFNATSSTNISGGTPVDKQTFQLKNGKNEIGTFIAGKGFNHNDDSICFVGWENGKDHTLRIIPTIGYDRWEAEECLNTEAVSKISYHGTDKIAAIYKASSPNAIAYESVIFAVKENNLIIDEALTRKYGSQGVKTVSELKSIMEK